MHYPDTLYTLEKLTFSLSSGVFRSHFLEAVGLCGAVKGNVMLDSSYCCLWLLMKYRLPASDGELLGCEGDADGEEERLEWRSPSQPQPRVVTSPSPRCEDDSRFARQLNTGTAAALPSSPLPRSCGDERRGTQRLRTPMMGSCRWPLGWARGPARLPGGCRAPGAEFSSSQFTGVSSAGGWGAWVAQLPTPVLGCDFADPLQMCSQH